MTGGIDRELLAERAASVTRHLDRVAAHLPGDPSQLQPIDRSDGHRRPAAGFRNLVVHGYGSLDLRRVHAIAQDGPADLRAFLAALRDRTRD